MTKRIQQLAVACAVVVAGKISAQEPLYTPGQPFSPTTRFVGAIVFHWYTASGGQTVGPWVPEEGRSNWTGDPAFWQRQIKDIMDANIDVMYVHLWRGFEEQRVNLFAAAAQLRAQGYAVPYIAPFLDTMIIWESNPLDLATPADKDEFVGEYIRFFSQYFSRNTDADAESFLAHVGTQVLLNTWHLSSRFIFNRDGLTRADVESRLAAALGATHPGFNNGVYMVGSGSPLTWFDEDAYQFADTLSYLSLMQFNNRKVATLRAGYWDELIRDPGRFVPRAGGVNCLNAWSCVNAIKDGGQVSCPPPFSYVNQGNGLPIYHVIIESWNEYSEGTGIYAANPGPPLLPPNGHTDTWSDTNNPREYIDTTAGGAAQFNDRPLHDARVLGHDLPAFMWPGQTMTRSITVRNEGDGQWNAASGCQLGQGPSDATLFGPGRYLLNDTQDEIPKYGGIFRGRPKTFQVHLTAPLIPGVYPTHWQMLQAPGDWFGQNLTITIRVGNRGDFDFDGDVDQTDFGHFQGCLSGSAQPYAEGCADADLTSDGSVNEADFAEFQIHMGGPNNPPPSVP